MRSRTAPATPPATNAIGSAARNGTPARVISDARDVAAEHGERAVREVDEVHQPHRHRQPDADQEQQAAVRDAIEQER